MRLQKDSYGTNRDNKRKINPSIIVITAICLTNFMACTTPALPTSDEGQELHGSIADWPESDTTYHTKPDSVRDMTHEDSIRFGYFN